MLGIVLFLFTLASGFFVGNLITRRTDLAQRASFSIGLVFFFVPVQWIMVRHLPFDIVAEPITGMLLLAGMGLVEAVAWMPYLNEYFAWGITVGLPNWLMSDHRLEMPVTFDKGDAALKAGDPRRALAHFRAELERHPDHPDLFLKLAEVHRALKDPAQMIACFREAARCAAEPHRKGPLLLMLSEEMGRADRREDGAEVLRALLASPLLSAYHAAARGRLGGLERAG